MLSFFNSDSFAECNECLANQVTELKEVLVQREQRHKKQKELFKKMAVDAQDKLKKALADVANFSEELKSCKGKS